MAFTTQRGRPRAPLPNTDCGTPELRMKHALGLTAEPIDVCLEKQLITNDQHWCGLHLRWLYTLRYGAPNLTARYIDRESLGIVNPHDPTWRAMREQEYHDAAHLLHQHKRYECVMRLAIFNEFPAFLNPHLRARSWDDPALARQLHQRHQQLHSGLELLAQHWRRRPHTADAQKAQTIDR